MVHGYTTTDDVNNLAAKSIDETELAKQASIQRKLKVRLLIEQYKQEDVGLVSVLIVLDSLNIVYIKDEQSKLALTFTLAKRGIEFTRISNFVILPEIGEDAIHILKKATSAEYRRIKTIRTRL